MATKTGIFGASAAPIVKPNRTARQVLYANLLPKIYIQLPMAAQLNKLLENQLTLLIGLHTNDDRLIARSTPPVERLIASPVVPKSKAISLLALRSEVDEKEAASAVQEVAKTMIHFRHKGMLSYRAEAFVSTFSKSEGVRD